MVDRSPPVWVVRALDNPATLLVARICLALPFLVGGLSKLVFWDDGVVETASFGLQPAWAFNLATIVTELGGSLLLISGRLLWLGAGALAVFTVFATLLGHRFWVFDGPQRTAEMNVFLEHAAISAAFILVAVVAIRDAHADAPR
jgi:transmembrane protein